MKRPLSQRLERGFRSRSILFVFLGLAACTSQPSNPSEESQFLQMQLIPEMIRWSKSDVAILPLHKHLSRYRFERLCTVAEYQSLSVIEDESPSIKHYRGSVGNMVPETRVAVVGVRGDTAHVGYLLSVHLNLYNYGSRCSAANKSILKRVHRDETTIPEAVVEDAA